MNPARSADGRRARIVAIESGSEETETTAGFLRDEPSFEIVALPPDRASMTAIRRQAPDAVLIDRDLAEIDGLGLARDLAAESDVAIVFTSGRDDEVDRILGLELGGDDYLVRPFNPRELVARIRSVLRRRRRANAGADAADVRTFGGWMVDLTRRELSDPDGQVVRLTRGEFDLLAALVQGRGRPVSRDYLIEVISNRGDEVSDRSVVTLVSRLRRKMETDPENPSIILTEHGAGYRLGA